MQNKIEIINQCNQDWNQMKDFNQNKFCDKCEKEVVDFTDLTRQQIIKRINSPKGVCAKIKKSQLDLSSKKISKNNYFNKAAFFIGLGTLIGFNEPVLANKSEHKTEIREKSEWRSIFPKKKINDSIRIVGNVIGSDSLPLPGTNVIYKGSQIATLTDFDGNFEIKIPLEKLSEENYLTFSFIGFKSKEYKFSKADTRMEIELTVDAEMEEEVIVLGGISYRQNIFNRIGNFFHNLFSSNKTCN